MIMLSFSPMSSCAFTILAEIWLGLNFIEFLWGFILVLVFFFCLWAKSFLHNEDGKLFELAERFHLEKTEMGSDG